MSREYILHAFTGPAALQIDYARELNPQQLAAVTAVPGPALVIAGAGSGKTRTLTYRVAYLIEQGVPADRILLLTFTNKAAKEMMRRVSDILGGDLSSLWGGTFHSIANRLLRRHADRIGYRPDFTILDREDSKNLLSAAVDEAKIDITATRFPKPDVLSNIFSLSANTERPIPKILEEEYDYYVELAPQIVDLQQRYTARKRSTNVMDFDDLLLLWLKLLQDHSDIASEYQRRFQFILVDEYQDTNKIQSDIVDALGAQHRNVMVVGDDSQSIYSWRGAHFQNIFRFPQRYAGTTTYRIETNYRSTPEILGVANAAIAPNSEQITKTLIPARKPGAKPVLAVCGDASQQAAFVAQRALELRDEGYNLNDIAVLYRSHFHALELQLELTRRNIPFSITSGIRFFEQAHIKDVVASLKLACNPRDELSFKRIVRLLPGIGGKGADKLWACFLAHLNSNPVPAVDSSPALPVLGVALQSCIGSVPKKAVVGWAQLTATMAQLEIAPAADKPARMIELILDAGYEDYLKANFTNYRTRKEDLQQFAAFAGKFKGTNDFLTELALASNLDAADDGPASNDSEQIKLSTIHQAKGLEFGAVFVIMLCDGLFPSARSFNRLETEEEERRLFYVAITRAKSELYLSYPLVRPASAYNGDARQQPSRFLNDLPPQLLDTWNLISYSSYG